MEVLISGASGALGSGCVRAFETAGHRVTTLGRDALAADPSARYDAVVWAQGVNSAGDILHTDSDEWTRVWQANVGFIVDSLRQLLVQGSIASGARLVVISSVWQLLGRSEKVAYATTKAALGGLVRALCSDLGELGIAINAVLPGVVDTPMTRAQLNADQVYAVAQATPLRRLVTVEEIAQTVLFLASPAASGISGQSITVDLGWAVTRHV